jgi:hypothetical protein
VQVKITIEVTAEQSQIVPFLTAATRLFQDHPRTADDAAAWWTAERAAAFVRTLKPPALHALRIIAAGAPRVAIPSVQREMGRAGVPMTPGGLSSIGFAVRRLGSPPPFVRDHYQRAYLMERDVAEVLLRAIEDETRRRRQLRDTSRDGARRTF